VSRRSKKAAPASERVPKVPEARRVRVRELRAHFKSLLAEGAPLIVGSRWQPKAIVLPVLTSWLYRPAEQKLVAHRLRACLEAAVKSLKTW
jgi:hypothetical protein